MDAKKAGGLTMLLLAAAGCAGSLFSHTYHHSKFHKAEVAVATATTEADKKKAQSDYNFHTAMMGYTSP